MNPKTRLLARLIQERFSRNQRTRVPEPMVMDDSEAVAAFDAAHPVLQMPIYRVNALALSRLLPENGVLLDLGSGSGRLLLDLVAARPDVRVIGRDLAPGMVAAGRAATAEAGHQDRLSIDIGDMTAVTDIPDRIDVVSCIWALHHLPDRATTLRALSEIDRIRRARQAAVWIFDFARMRREATFRAVIDLVPDVDPRLHADARASEAAAWTPAEMRAMLHDAGLEDLDGGAERRIGHLQAWRTPDRPSGSAHERLWSPQPLRPRSAEDLFGRISAGLPGLR